MSENRMQTTGLRLKTYGIDVSKYDDSFLNSSIQKGVDDTLCGSREDYIGLLGSDEREKSRFKAILHNNYSEFFRNTLTFSVIERIILPELTAKKRALKNSVIRIWSAACAGGQEPYSLAMVIEEYKNGQQDRLRYHIFATDQDESQVILAQ
ncbi:MAG: CheR family methyltransferase, partial [Bacteroidota bacterium]